MCETGLKHVGYVGSCRIKQVLELSLGGLGIYPLRIMANLSDRKYDQPRVDHWGQSGHFYLAESGHFYLAVTTLLRIMYIMLNDVITSVCNRRCAVGTIDN